MFLIYTDEAGVPTYVKAQEEPLFILAGIAVHETKWRALEAGFTDIKKAFFPHFRPEQVEIKGRLLKSALVGRAPRNSPLASLTTERARELAQGIFQLFDPNLVLVFAVGVDKAAMTRRYQTPWHVYDIAYGILTQKVTEHLENVGDTDQGLFILDKQSEVERRVLNLRDAAETLKEHSPRPVNLDRIVEMPLFVDSKQHHGVQLADLAAHIVYQIIARREFDSQYFQQVETCFARDQGTGKYYGFGFQGFPEYASPPYSPTGVRIHRWGSLRDR